MCYGMQKMDGGGFLPVVDPRMTTEMRCFKVSYPTKPLML